MCSTDFCHHSVAAKEKQENEDENVNTAYLDDDAISITGDFVSVLNYGKRNLKNPKFHSVTFTSIFCHDPYGAPYF